MSDLMNVKHDEAWWHRVRLWLGLKARSKRVRWADGGFHATVWIEIEDAYHCISRGTLAMSAMSAYIYILSQYIILYYIYIIYIDIDSISIIFGVTMCDIPYLSSVSVSYFEGLPDWDFGTSKFSGPSPDEYCGLPDATASSSSSHSWAPRRSQRMGFTYGLTMFDHQEMGS